MTIEILCPCGRRIKRTFSSRGTRRVRCTCGNVHTVQIK